MIDMSGDDHYDDDSDEFSDEEEESEHDAHEVSAEGRVRAKVGLGLRIG